MKKRIESVCIFGSHARGSNDTISDRDVLLIAEDRNRRKHLVERWKNRGWSVACYSPSRFKKLIGAGSLFVQHLKHEGQIVSDAGKWLESCLAAAVPKKRYAGDAARSVILALPIERLEADALIANNLIAADLAFVAIRNFGVCHLADKNRLCFDYSAILAHLGKDLDLDAKTLSLLNTLRQGKAAYRKGVDDFPIRGSIGELREALSNLFELRPLLEIGSDQPIRWLGGGYPTLREFETSVVARLGHAPTAEEIEELGLSTVWRWVRSPRDYSWDIRNLSESRMSMLEHVVRNIPSARHEEDALPAWSLPWTFGRTDRISQASHIGLQRPRLN